MPGDPDEEEDPSLSSSRRHRLDPPIELVLSSQRSRVTTADLPPRIRPPSPTSSREDSTLPTPSPPRIPSASASSSVSLSPSRSQRTTTTTTTTTTTSRSRPRPLLEHVVYPVLDVQQDERTHLLGTTSSDVVVRLDERKSPQPREPREPRGTLWRESDEEEEGEAMRVVPSSSHGGMSLGHRIPSRRRGSGDMSSSSSPRFSADGGGMRDPDGDALLFDVENPQNDEETEEMRSASRRTSLSMQRDVPIESSLTPATYSARVVKFRPDADENKCECPLYPFEEAAPWMQFNKFILTGYRSYYSMQECLLSWFRIHNETVNIWTHFLAAVGFLGLMGYSLFSPNLLAGDYEMKSWADYAVQMLFLCGAFYCFLSSTIYHTLSAHRSFTVYLVGYTCDLVGISSMIAGSSFPAIYYGFYCQQFWKYFYGIIVAVLFVSGFVLAVIPKFSTNPKLILFRTFSFVVTASFSFSLLPALHWFATTSSYEAQHFFLPLCGMWACYTVAFLFYFTYYPERKYPGRFDILFASHQWWHIFIISAAVIWWWALKNYFLWRMEQGPNQCS